MRKLWLLVIFVGMPLWGQDISGLKSASVVSVLNDNINGIFIAVSVTDMAGNTKQWSEYVTDPSEQKLWQMDQKAVITLAYQKAAKSLFDDVTEKNKPQPMPVVVSPLSAADALAYEATAQAELQTIKNMPIVVAQ